MELDSSELNESLFEGMTLFTSSSSSSAVDLPPSPRPPESPSLRRAQSPSLPRPQSPTEPLDEDLFSDLTLQLPAPSLSPAQSQTPPESPARAPFSSNRVLKQQVSRKKKRAVRIGYAREAVSLDDEPHIPSSSFSSTPLPPHYVSSASEAFPSDPVTHQDVPSLPFSQPDDTFSPSNSTEIEEKEQPTLNSEPESEESSAVINQDTHTNNEEECPVHKDVKPDEADPLDSITQKLSLIRDKISAKVDSARQIATSVTSKRKELASKRRKVREELNKASKRYNELEMELEEACEAEDFERAEKISDSLASVERDKNQFLLDLKATELDYDSIDSEMQEVLNLHISAEEETISLLQNFSEVASEYAELIRKTGEEKSSKELSEWEESMELLEIKKMEMNIESELITESQAGLQSSINKLVEDDMREKENLNTQRNILAKELADLLQLVKLKEQEIALNDTKIEDVDQRISNVTSEFHATESTIKTKLEDLKSAQINLDSENKSLSIKKKEIDEFVLLSVKKRSRLLEISSSSSNEVKTCEDLVEFRKNLAASILKRRQDRIYFAKLEETISDDVQSLKQQVSDSRSTLQELLSRRGSTEEEIVSINQRTSYIEKRAPELEAEKKVAASARNFKEAGRISGEAKALNAEKEQLQNKLSKSREDLSKVEEEMRSIEERIEECEKLILAKEKEGAMASYKRLRLLAGEARADREAAIFNGDVEEGALCVIEAEDAEMKARELDEMYCVRESEFEGGELGVGSEESVGLVVNASAIHLERLASSLSLDSLS